MKSYPDWIDWTEESTVALSEFFILKMHMFSPRGSLACE